MQASLEPLATRKALWQRSMRCTVSMRTRRLSSSRGSRSGVFPTGSHAPLVLMATSNLVGKWATSEHYYELERRGLIMFGGYTAGDWQYIGSQGIVQGTYQTFAAVGRGALRRIPQGPPRHHRRARRHGRRPATCRSDGRRGRPLHRGGPPAHPTASRHGISHAQHGVPSTRPCSGRRRASPPASSLSDRARSATPQRYSPRVLQGGVVPHVATHQMPA